MPGSPCNVRCTVIDSEGADRYINAIFDPLFNPYTVGGNKLVTRTEAQTWSAITTGFMAVSLMPGLWRVTIDQDQFKITVPDDASSHNLTDIITP